MALNFQSILATIAAVLFAVAGVVNLAGLGAVKRDFARWGYPAWFPLLSSRPGAGLFGSHCGYCGGPRLRLSR